MNQLKGSILSWNHYFILRRMRRYYEIGFTAAITVLPFSAAFHNPQFVHDSLGLDPFVTMFGLGAAGFLSGPLIGKELFYKVHRPKMIQMEYMDSLLREKIEKYRPPPEASTYVASFPDYYGESIVSIETYRVWLRRQRKFRENKYRQ